MQKVNTIPPEKLAEWQAEVDYIEVKKPADLGAISRIFNAIREWWEDLFAPLNNTSSNISANDIILYASIIITIIVVIIFIKKKYFNLKTPLTSEKKFTTDAIDPEVIESINFEKLINQAEKQEDWRLYTRFQFLLLLQRLDKLSLIEWSKNKTNQNYAIELQLTNYKSDFNNCRIIFEKVWYGEKQTTAELIEDIRLAFSNLNKKLSKH